MGHTSTKISANSDSPASAGHSLGLTGGIWWHTRSLRGHLSSARAGYHLHKTEVTEDRGAPPASVEPRDGLPPSPLCFTEGWSDPPWHLPLSGR